VSHPKVVVHTDIILDYLLHRQRRPPVLRLLMMKFFCYTTVFNAIELFSLAEHARERRAVEDALSAMKILGLNAKHAKRYGEWFAQVPAVSAFNKLIAGVCIESRLPLVTGEPRAYRGIEGLKIIRSSSVDDGLTAAQILARARVLK
jgi:predicted nucleic acid-binding protein